ncbi:archaemetzincin-1-like isoform X2 [Conger conger]|uniref:archaemetzincin-1-like isoform X2 n=1 Tax=Conger conger TaxID=82655 RepID=UPI002A59C2D9|nr:archaemetzincin-1-like isoform X2 [Conger conger]
MLQHRHVQEFCVGPHTLKEALISSNASLRDLYTCTYSCAERHFFSEAYNPNRVLFQTLLIRTPFDWIVSRPEEPQDFESFYNSTRRHQCNSRRKKIYLQPIDMDIPKQGAGILFLDDLKSYLEAFFLGLPVISLPCISTSSMKCNFRQQEHSCNVQLHTGVGVCSFSRLLGKLSAQASGMAEQAELGMVGAGGRHDRQAWPAQPHTFTLTTTELLQCCKVASHEVCHLVGLQNCRWLSCVMQGVSSPEESLLRPMDLCPICLRKLHYTLGFSLLQRYRKLQAWCHRVAFTWTPRERTRHASTETDICRFSSDTGIACEGTSQPASATLGLISPEVSVPRDRPHGGGSGTPAVPVRTQGEEGLAAVCRVELCADLLGDYEAWLDSCTRALQVEVTEDELSHLDCMVDAITALRVDPARVSSPRVSVQLPRAERNLRRAVGQTFAWLLRKLRLRRLRMDHSRDDSED